MNIPNMPKNVNDILPPGVLNNLTNIKNPMGAINDILPTGMLNNILPGGNEVGVSIRLDNPTNCFYAGTVVTGLVTIQVDKPENIKSLSIKVRGVANVSWNETETETKTVPGTGSREHLNQQEQQSVTVVYSSEEEYFNNKFNILGETQIGAGTHTYQFSCPLPPLLPSSFSGDHGGIKYTVKANVDRSWKLDQTAELEFKVVTPMDLNHNAVAKESVKKEESKTFCCLFCQSGPLTLVAALPHKGYVSGQIINVAVEADNASNVEVNKIFIKLRKTVTWICHSPRKKEKSSTTDLAIVSMEGVPSNGSKTWSQQITTPTDMRYSNIDACSLIKIKHYLEVVAEVGGCHSNLELNIPLIFGTVPIRDDSGISPMFSNGAPDVSIPSNPAANVNPAGYTAGQPGGYPPASQPGGYPASQPGGYPASQPGGYPASQPGGYPAGQPGGYPAGQPGGYPPASQPGGYPAGQPGGYPHTGQPGGYPPAGQPGGYPPAGQPGGYPPAVQPGGYPPAGQPGGYPSPVQPGGYPSTVPAFPSLSTSPSAPSHPSAVSQPLLPPDAGFMVNYGQ